MNQEDFESELIAFLTKGDGEFLRVLRDHFMKAVVVSREMTGVGFFVNYALEANSLKKFSQDCTFGDVIFFTDDMPEGGGVVVYIKDGYLSSIEGYSYSDHWSCGYPGLRFQYSEADRRLPEQACS